MNSPKLSQSISPNKCLFYEDVKQFAKVYFVNAVAVRIRQSFQFYGIAHILSMVLSLFFKIVYEISKFLDVNGCNFTEKNSSCSFVGPSLATLNS